MSLPNTRSDRSTALSDWARGAIAALGRIGLGRASPLVRISAANPRFTILLKDESVQPTGSIKARLALRLIEDAIRDGRIEAATRLVDVSSGSTAIAEAAVAKRLGLSFTAIVPRGTTDRKIAEIEGYGGTVRLAENLEAACDEAAHLGARPGTCYLDQFGKAGAALDYQGPESLAGELFPQVRLAAGGRDPSAVFLSVGTGGSLAALAAAVRREALPTHICLADPVGSDLHHIWCGSNPPPPEPIMVEGIGGRTRPGFRPELVDSAVPVADADSIAAAHMLSRLVGKPVGGSTGTAFWALAENAASLGGSTPLILVSIIYDDGRRYADTIYSADWLSNKGLDIGPGCGFLAQFLGVQVPECPA